MLYSWPVTEDMSWESCDQVLRVLKDPQLLVNRSTNRHQVFAFQQVEIKAAKAML